MKLPLWLVVILLIGTVLAVLGAGAWWWAVIWPDHTMHAYLNAMDMAVDYRKIVSISARERNRHLCPIANLEPSDIITEPLRLSDALRGRRFYRLPICVAFDDSGNVSDNICYMFTVERGSIQHHGGTVPMERFRRWRLPAGASRELALAAAAAERD
jgi:hypothetical protein